MTPLLARTEYNSDGFFHCIASSAQATAYLVQILEIEINTPPQPHNINPINNYLAGNQIYTTKT